LSIIDRISSKLLEERGKKEDVDLLVKSVPRRSSSSSKLNDGTVPSDIDSRQEPGERGTYRS